MSNKKVCFILLTSLIITSLFGCGSGGGTANLDVSTSSNSTQLESISLTPTNPTIAVDSDIQFIATGIYSDNTTKDLTSTVTWTSSAMDALDVASGADVAQFTGFSASTANNSSTLLSAGRTKATRSGKAKITAKWGNISGSTIVTVTSATLVSIAITPTNPSIVKGTNQQFVATGTFSDNTTQDLTITVTWSSSDAAVAAISNAAGSNGLATSVAAGSTTITATSGSVSGTATLTVTVGGVVSLAWDAPTTNTDGSSLNPATDLSLYKIYYGSASLTYTTVENVTNPGTTTISITLNLSPGTYYFSVTTVDASGQESSYSNEVMKTI
jgi:trimeric autotransporter adhesin